VERLGAVELLASLVSVTYMETAAHYDWTKLLADQLDSWWRAHLRPRMDGLTDEEYHWEPVPGMWGVRPRGTSTTPGAAGGGAFTLDHSSPAPVPPPATTIAWRMMHLAVGCFGIRAASHFGAPPVDYETYDYPGDAATALDRLDASYELWMNGVQALRPADLMRPIGPSGGSYAEDPMVALIVHINREALHHGAEIALLRDLYYWRDKPPGATDLTR
jgi:hypothetical protein